jgi:hypothetical protein
VAIEIGEAGSNNPAKIEESFFIDLVAAQQFQVVAKIATKPGELPKGPFGAVQASREGKRFMRSGLENGEADGKEFWGCQR